MGKQKIVFNIGRIIYEIYEKSPGTKRKVASWPLWKCPGKRKNSPRSWGFPRKRRAEKAFDFTSNTSSCIYHNISWFRAHFNKKKVQRLACGFFSRPGTFPLLTQDKDRWDILVFFITFLHWWRRMLVKRRSLGPTIWDSAPSFPEDT